MWKHRYRQLCCMFVIIDIFLNNHPFGIITTLFCTDEKRCKLKSCWLFCYQIGISELIMKYPCCIRFLKRFSLIYFCGLLLPGTFKSTTTKIAFIAFCQYISRVSCPSMCSDILIQMNNLNSYLIPWLSKYRITIMIYT